MLYISGNLGEYQPECNVETFSFFYYLEYVFVLSKIGTFLQMKMIYINFSINGSGKYFKFNEIKNKIFLDALSKSDARWDGKQEIFFIWPYKKMRGDN